MSRRFLLLLAWGVLPAVLACADEKDVRYPFVAGSFYPQDPGELSRAVDSYLNTASPEEKEKDRIAALIMPHAGYVYSGRAAAFGYKLIAGREVDTVVLIGPYHKALFDGASVWPSGSWRTPLGEVPVDAELAKALLSEGKLFSFTQDAHSAEHSLEVQLPFLQRTLRGFKILPILVSDPSLANCRRIAEALVKHTQGKRVLFIASTDLSHYRSDAATRPMDARTIAFIVKGDTEGLLKEVVRGRSELCGTAATLTVLETCKLLGKTNARILKYATSADATEDTARVVGYGALALYKDPEQNFSRSAKPAEQTSYTPAQRKELLRISRQTLETAVRTGRVGEFEVSDPVLAEERAAFVTLRRDGQLRGCIGNIYPREPLHQAVRNLTIASATEDPRFRPVTPDELEELSIEISVLSLPRRVRSAHEVDMGMHGVIVKKGSHQGVFLPKVADETQWTKEEFLSELCTQKAGLPADCWRDPTAELYVFTAEDFGEK